MISTNITFKDFLKVNFYNDQVNKNEGFSFLVEMAKSGDIIRKPVLFDEEDDIDFLKQFPQSYYASAMKQRYDMLFDELEKLHKKREMGYEQLYQNIYNAISVATEDKGDIIWDRKYFQGISNVDFEKLKKYLKPEKLRTKLALKGGADKEVELRDIAKRLAIQLHAKNIEDVLSNEHEMDFEFTKNERDPLTLQKIGSPSSKEKVIIKAKPYLNRLYHKLEKTKGRSHSKESGLMGRGKYGFDLFFPERMTVDSEGKTLPEEQKLYIKKSEGDYQPLDSIGQDDVKYNKQGFGKYKGEYVYRFNKTQKRYEILRDKDPIAFYNTKKFTAGFSFPAATTYEDRLNEFLKNQAYEIFDEVPQFIEENGEKIPVVWYPSEFIDNRSEQIFKNEKFYELYFRDEEFKNQYPLPKDRRKAAVAAANAEFARLMESPNKPTGMPHPKEKGTNPPKSEWVADSYTIVNGKPVPPRLWLPMIERKIKFVKNGKEVTETKLTPYMKGAKFYRMADEGDYDEKGNPKEKDENGNPIKFVGHNKQFVLVSDKNWSGAKVQRDSAINFNHDTSAVDYLHLGDPRWEGRYRNFIQNLDKAILIPEGGNKWKVVKLEENQKPTKDAQVFYYDIAQGMANCLRSEKCAESTPGDREAIWIDFKAYHDEILFDMIRSLGSSELESEQGRRKFAFNFIIRLVQTNISGRGTRRLRGSVQSYNVDVQSKEGQTEMASLIATNELLQAQKTSSSRQRGQRKTFTNLRVLQDALAELRKEISQQDQKLKDIRNAAQAEVGEISNIDSLAEHLKRTRDIKQTIINILTLAALNSNLEKPEEYAQNWFTQQMEGQNLDSNVTQRLYQKLLEDENVRTLLKVSPDQLPQHQFASKNILSFVKDQLSKEIDEKIATLPKRTIDAIKDVDQKRTRVHDGRQEREPLSTEELYSYIFGKVPIDIAAIQEEIKDKLQDYLDQNKDESKITADTINVIFKELDKHIRQKLFGQTEVLRATATTPTQEDKPEDKKRLAATAGPTPIKNDLQSLRDEKNYFDYVQHPEFLAAANPATLEKWIKFFATGSPYAQTIGEDKAKIARDKLIQAWSEKT